MLIRYETNWLGHVEIIAEDGQTVYEQSDWSYPGIASTFGWIPCKECNATDGTVDCEHRTASTMIGEAWEYLVEHKGESTIDPGYFLSHWDQALLDTLTQLNWHYGKGDVVALDQQKRRVTIQCPRLKPHYRQYRIAVGGIWFLGHRRVFSLAKASKSTSAE